MEPKFSAQAEAIYSRAIQALQEAGVPFLVGGALALHHYAGVWRNTKDLDLFLLPEDRDRALMALAGVGFRVEITAAHWLAKAIADEQLVDLISGFGNWLAPVDQQWFTDADPLQIFGYDVHVVSIADLIWMKSYVAGRERFDGADIAHLIHGGDGRIDWQRLLDRFGADWELLLVYLHFYRFVDPQARDAIPRWVMEELLSRAHADLHEPAESAFAFRGPLLDRYAYLVDLEEWGAADPREELARQRALPLEDVVLERAADRRRVDEGQVPGQD